MVKTGSGRSRQIHADPTLPSRVLHAVDLENQFWEERLSHCLAGSLECQAFEAPGAQCLRKGSATRAQGGPQLAALPCSVSPSKSLSRERGAPPTQPPTHFLEQPAPCPGSLEEQPAGPSVSQPRSDSPGLAKTWREGRVPASETGRPGAHGGLGESAGGGGGAGEGGRAPADGAPAALRFTGPGCSAFAPGTGARVWSRGD